MALVHGGESSDLEVMATKLLVMLNSHGLGENGGTKAWDKLQELLGQVDDPRITVERLLSLLEDAKEPTSLQLAHPEAQALLREIISFLEKETMMARKSGMAIPRLRELVLVAANHLKMLPLRDSEPVHIVDGDTNFCEANVASIVRCSPQLSTPNAPYAVVSIVGAQSSGKSYLLNHLFGTKFPYARRGRIQTTKGIMISRCIGPSLLVLDVQGFDRGGNEQDTLFEKQAALFALTISDIMLVNMNVFDISRAHGGGTLLFKTIFEERGKLPEGLTKILVVLRMYDGETPLEMLRDYMMKSLEKVWKSVNVETLKFDDYIEVNVFGLPDKNSQDFPKEVTNLRNLLSNTTLDHNRSAKVPASSFVVSSSIFWDKIKKNKKLDIPSHQEALARIFCRQTVDNLLNSVGSSEDYKRLKDEESPHRFKEISDRLRESIIIMYDRETEMYDPKERDNGRQYMLEKLKKVFVEDSRELIRKMRRNTSEQFKGECAKHRQNMEGPEADLNYDDPMVESCIENFRSLCEDLKLFDLDYIQRICAELQNEMNSYIFYHILNIKEGINSMKSGQDPMVSYLTGSMNSLFNKLTKPKKCANFEALHDDLMTLNKDFFDKLVSNGRRVVDFQVKVWMKQVRELVFDIEDWIDEMPETIMGDLAVREETIEEFRTLIKEARRRCESYNLLVKAGADVAGFALEPSKVIAVYSPLFGGDKACDPVGLDDPKEMLKEHLLDEYKKLKVVSILGTGGLGKTTLAKELHGELQAEFSCGAFIYIGMNPSVWRILVNILYQSMSYSDRLVYFKAPLQHKYADFLSPCEREQEVILEKHLDEQQVIALLWENLSKKRYFIVLDSIWTIRHWRVINGALPDNNLGSRILTTTRIADVAESCSPGPTDVVYHMETLSKVESKMLFFGEEESVDDDEILEICGRIPLAITLAAGARKCEKLVEPKMLGKSLLSSLNQYSTSEGMTNILHMIYDGLSIPVRSCFLYLGVFRENYTIKKDRLILLWEAEGFIPIIYEECLWVTGERYFNELMSRRLIQPVFNFDDDQTVGCTIHSVILDFIRSMSREENFATELTSGPFPRDKIRRFSLDYGNEDEGETLSPSNVHLSSMRSLIVFGGFQGVSEGDEEIYDNTAPSVSRDDEGMFDDPSDSGDEDGMFDGPSFPEDDDPLVLRVSLNILSAFKLLRVLDLEDTSNLKYDHLEGIGGLVLLRYLGLGGTDINELPGDIGELEKLETLVLRRNGLIIFPASIVKLQKVRHLLLPVDAKQIWEMPELDVASGIRAENGSSLGKVVELLRKSERLRVLGVSLERSIPKATDIVSFLEAVVKSKLQSISLDYQCSVPLLVDSWEKVTAPLEKKFEPPRFELRIGVSLGRVPPNMGSLASLTHLHIELHEAKAEDLDVLGGLTNLVLLGLIVEVCSARERFIIKKGMFLCVKVFSFKTAHSWTGLEFEKGALQQLRWLGRNLGASVRGNQEYLDIGIEHLTCLTRVRATINCYGATVSEVEAAEATIRRKLSKIATKPRLELKREEKFPLRLRSEDSYLFSTSS